MIPNFIEGEMSLGRALFFTGLTLFLSIELIIRLTQNCAGSIALPCRITPTVFGSAPSKENFA